jgi:hypothetical protein
MNRRILYASSVLVLSLAGVAFFVCFPLWQIEHPVDASLVVRGERHWLWQPPTHAHIDPSTIVIPVLAIAVVTAALLVSFLQKD